MFELNIKGIVYTFNFGIGFVKEINPTLQKPVDGMPGVKEDLGLAFTVGKIISGDVLALADVLEVANKGFEPRITADIVAGYIEDPATDIDKLFEDVMGFFRTANATRRVTLRTEENMKAQTE